MVLHARAGVLGHELVHALLVVLTALPDDFEVLAARAAGLDPSLHRPVQRTAAETAAHDEQVLLLRIQVVVPHRLILHRRRWRGGDFLADGVAAHHDPVRREEAFHSLVGDADLLHPLPEELVRQAGEAVLLLDEGGDLHPRRSPEQGRARVAAHADDDVRLELPDELFRHRHAFQHSERHLEVVDDVFQVQLALHPDDREADDLVAGGRHLLHFHLAGGADEEDFRVRVQFLQFVRDRDGREDMAARAAAADDGA